MTVTLYCELRWLLLWIPSWQLHRISSWPLPWKSKWLLQSVTLDIQVFVYLDIFSRGLFFVYPLANCVTLYIQQLTVLPCISRWKDVAMSWPMVETWQTYSPPSLSSTPSRLRLLPRCSSPSIRVSTSGRQLTICSAQIHSHRTQHSHTTQHSLTTLTHNTRTQRHKQHSHKTLPHNTHTHHSHTTFTHNTHTQNSHKKPTHNTYALHSHNTINNTHTKQLHITLTHNTRT